MIMLSLLLSPSIQSAHLAEAKGITAAADQWETRAVKEAKKVSAGTCFIQTKSVGSAPGERIREAISYYVERSGQRIWGICHHFL